MFHSVSAFNNAGISLFTDGLANAAIDSHYGLHWTVTVLVFFGALGMVAIFDLFDPVRLRERMSQPWKHIGFATKIILYFSLGLVVFGTAAFWLLSRGYPGWDEPVWSHHLVFKAARTSDSTPWTSGTWCRCSCSLS